MVEAFKKVFFTSVGLALKGKDKVEEWANKFAEENKLSEEEGKSFVESIVKQSEEARENLVKFIDETVEKTINKVGLAQKKEVDKLKEELEALKKEKAEHEATKEEKEEPEATKKQ